jgi:hypothetical protein
MWYDPRWLPGIQRMPRGRVIFDFGVEAILEDGGGWLLTTSESKARTGNPEELLKAEGLVPQMLFRRTPMYSEEYAIAGVARNDVRALGFHPTNLIAMIPQEALNAGTRLALLCNCVWAMLYHLRNLADAYAELARCTAGTPGKKMDGYGLDIGDALGTSAELEFDAFSFKARIYFKTLRYALWQVFAPHGGTTPRSFDRTLEALGRMHKLPDNLQEHLESEWQSFGRRIADYRDCLAHNVTSLSRWGGVEGRIIRPDIWGIRYYLPDNPEVKSAKKFCYEKKIDALAYSGWVARKTIALSIKVIESALPEMKRT